ncbi:hypothetical protein [Kribbella shirazensis]|uniref:Uncharacterized protein n=1 Tax=Kribbella shirazensis TaxID=1105143 RepID=A0A7X5VCL6_9ACTN|nr:hypothetical protein [Kribbella shirazensis]NIK58321.1 hypothetical protein [Kribbella shirazensis]
MPASEITVNEWFRPWDFLWLAAGIAAITAIVWITVAVPAGDLVPLGNNSAFPKYADTHRAPLLIPLFAVLGWVGLKFACQLQSPLAARLDQHGIKLYAGTNFGLRTKIGPPRAEAPWDAIARVVLRYRPTKLLKFIPTRTTVLSFERPNGKPYGHRASVSPWSLHKIAAATTHFAPHVEVTDERYPRKPRVVTP